MSRQIDLSKRLSAEDREYLDSRARHDLIAQNDQMFGTPVDPTRIDDGNTGDIDPFKADDGSDLLAGTHPAEKPVNPIQAVEIQGVSDLDDKDKDPAGVVAGVPEPSRQAGDGDDEPEPEKSDAVGPRTTGVDDDGDNYDDEDVWSYRDVQEEVKGRKEDYGDKYSGPALNASREDLIEWLRKDDAED